MLTRWGDYAHSPGSVRLSIDRLPVLNAGQVQVGVKEAWTLRGLLYSRLGAADIDAQIAALMAAYATGGKDMVLTMPDGVTPTASVLRNSEALGGTRVTKYPSFPTTEGVERVNTASYELTVEAEFPLSSTAFVLLNFSEKLMGAGGGSVIAWLKPAVGSPVAQVVRQQDTFRVVQSGFAEGYLDYPDVPFPIWPGFLIKAPEIEFSSPDKLGDGRRRFGVTWKYDFEADIPLIGVPNSW
jgi:hypothetical protein